MLVQSEESMKRVYRSEHYRALTSRENSPWTGPKLVSEEENKMRTTAERPMPLIVRTIRDLKVLSDLKGRGPAFAEKQ